MIQSNKIVLLKPYLVRFLNKRWHFRSKSVTSSVTCLVERQTQTYKVSFKKYRLMEVAFISQKIFTNANEKSKKPWHLVLPSWLLSPLSFISFFVSLSSSLETSVLVTTVANKYRRPSAFIQTKILRRTA